METKEKIEGSDENESMFKKSSGENESIFKETDLMHAVEDEYKDDILTTDVYNKETGSYHVCKYIKLWGLIAVHQVLLYTLPPICTILGFTLVVVLGAAALSEKNREGFLECIVN